jgi:hypothetical protein
VYDLQGKVIGADPILRVRDQLEDGPSSNRIIRVWSAEIIGIEAPGKYERGFDAFFRELTSRGS